jgi:hypothetical protein
LSKEDAPAEGAAKAGPLAAAADSTQYVVMLATFLKERASELRPMGPTVSVLLEDDGPIGVHIAQAGPDRVCIVSCPPAYQAYRCGKIRFGDQLLQVGSNSTLGLKMKQVKLMISDSFRPVSIKLQPLCLSGQGVPMVPPPPPFLGLADRVFELTCRDWALERAGAPCTITVKNTESVRWTRAAAHVLVTSCGEDASAVGMALLAVDGRAVDAMGDRELANSIVLCSKEVALTLQRYEATGARTCIYCGARGWMEAKFCWNCGENPR